MGAILSYLFPTWFKPPVAMSEDEVRVETIRALLKDRGLQVRCCGE
jgi:hypothetical protein